MQVNNVLNQAGTALPDNLLNITSGIWCVFDAAGTLIGSEGTDGVTDNGTGDFNPNFTNDTANANYGVLGMARSAVINNILVAIKTGTTPTVSTVNIVTVEASSNSLADSDRTTVAILGGQ
jgi:hypothetical protein